MSCSRAQEIDLLGFLEAPRRPEYEAFRDHYPRCRECAAEVRAWTELQLGLQAQGAGHPEPELLLAWAEAPDGLAAPERNALSSHLEGCPTCRDELRALGAWAPVGDAPASPWRGGWAWLRRVTWHPAFAYALVGLLLFPVLYRALDSDPERAFRELEAPTPAPATPAAPSELRERRAAADAANRRGLAPPAALPERPAPADAAKSEGSAPSDPRAGEALRDAPRLSGASAPAEPAANPTPAEVQEESAGTAPLRLARSSEAEPPRAGAAGDLAEARLAVRPLVDGEPADEAFVEGRSDPVAQAPQPAAPVVRLRSAEEPLRIEPGRAAAGLALRIPLPPIGSEGAEVTVELAEASGPRVLRERLRLEPGTPAVDVEVPPLWLAPGRYRASVREGRGRFAVDFRLEVAPR